MEEGLQVSEAMRGTPIEGLTIGSDPLGDLAAALGTQEDILENNIVDVPEIDMQPERGVEVPMQQSVQAINFSDLNQLQSLYATSCAAQGETPNQEHLLMLADVPASLYVSLVAKRAPSAVAGGAALTLPASATATETQARCLLDTIFGVQLQSKALLLDHLDISGMRHVTPAILGPIVQRAAQLGLWWRLRSLYMSNCGLLFSHLEHLLGVGALPFLWHLQSLDLSNNPGLGCELETGDLLPASKFAHPGLVFFLHLWREAPLRYINLQSTGLSTEVLIGALRVLRTYPLPSLEHACGTPLHDGARPALECIKLGPPTGPSGWSRSLVQEVLLLSGTAPRLLVVELHGVDEVARQALAQGWSLIFGERSMPSADIDVQAGVVRLVAGSAVAGPLSIESPPLGHTLPGPETPQQGIDLEEHAEPALLDDWGLGRQQQTGGGTATATAAAERSSDGRAQTNRAAVLATNNRSHARTGDMLPPRCPGGAAKGRAGDGRWGAGTGMPRQGSRPRTDSGTVGREGRETGPSKQRKRKSGGERDGSRVVRAYRGGRAEDDLPDRGIDLGSDDEEEHQRSDDESEGESGSEGGYSEDEHDARREDPREDMRGDSVGGGRPNRTQHYEERRPPTTQPASQAEPFRLRDGALDEDSHLGRIWRSDARRYIKQIPNAKEQAAARRAFKLWDDCAENAWDRHRWDRPSRTQNDEPHILGQLNLLYDILHKHDMPLGFPFPKWVKGAGAAAFEDAPLRPHAPPQMPAPRPQPLPSERPPSDASAQAEPRLKSGRTKRRRNNMVDDGGRGKDSDGEYSEDSGGSFLVGDEEGDDDSSSSDSDREGGTGDQMEVVNLVSQSQEAEEPASLPHRTQPNARRALIDSDEESEDKRGDIIDEDHPTETPAGDGGSAAIDDVAAARRARELARLSAWGWDSRIEAHPPNQERYGPKEGKRTRKSHISMSQLNEALGSEEQEALLPFEQTEDGDFAWDDDEEELALAEDIDANAADNQPHACSSSSDDDTPLIQLARPAGRPHPTVAERTTPPQENPAPAPAPEPLLEIPAALRAAAAAQALLGSLYVSPPVVPAANIHGSGGVPAQAAVLVEQPTIIPDSQEEEDWA